jgi:hypothetical protein
MKMEGVSVIIIRRIAGFRKRGRRGLRKKGISSSRKKHNPRVIVLDICSFDELSLDSNEGLLCTLEHLTLLIDAT